MLAKIWGRLTRRTELRNAAAAEERAAIEAEHTAKAVDAALVDARAVVTRLNQAGESVVEAQSDVAK